MSPKEPRITVEDLLKQYLIPDGYRDMLGGFQRESDFQSHMMRRYQQYAERYGDALYGVPPREHDVEQKIVELQEAIAKILVEGDMDPDEDAERVLAGIKMRELIQVAVDAKREMLSLRDQVGSLQAQVKRMREERGPAREGGGFPAGGRVSNGGVVLPDVDDPDARVIYVGNGIPYHVADRPKPPEVSANGAAWERHARDVRAPRYPRTPSEMVRRAYEQAQAEPEPKKCQRCGTQWALDLAVACPVCVAGAEGPETP